MSECEGHGGLMHVHGATEGPGLVISLAATVLFVLFEAVAGWLAHSLALLSDAGHNASDALALGLAAYAIWIARKPADRRRTYGYHRVAILTALFNSASLVAIAAVIVLEAIESFRHPSPVAAPLMIAVAAASVLMNTLIAWALSGGAKHSLNLRAAYIHMLGDAASAAAVIVAGVVIRMTGWVYADPMASLLIAAFLVYSAWGVTREGVNVLLESAPDSVDVEAMAAAMERYPGVLHVHDVHVWAMTDGINYMSCHVELADGSSIEDVTQVVGGLNHLLQDSFGIGHATIQAELDGSCSGGAHDLPRYCQDV